MYQDGEENSIIIIILSQYHSTTSADRWTESALYVPHVLRSEEDELSVWVVLSVLQHQSHADAAIHHVLRQKRDTKI